MDGFQRIHPFYDFCDFSRMAIFLKYHIKDKKRQNPGIHPSYNFRDYLSKMTIKTSKLEVLKFLGIQPTLYGLIWYWGVFRIIEFCQTTFFVRIDFQNVLKSQSSLKERCWPFLNLEGSKLSWGHQKCPKVPEKCPKSARKKLKNFNVNFCRYV